MGIKSPFDRSTDDLAALTSRAQGSFLGRCVLRFVRIGGLDRCIVLSSQAFTALIPLLILAGALAPAGDEDAVAQSLIRKFGLSGDSADAVTQLFTTPAGGSSGVGIFSAFLLLFSGVSFTRRLQRMYRAAWEQEKAGVLRRPVRCSRSGRPDHRGAGRVRRPQPVQAVPTRLVVGAARSRS